MKCVVISEKKLIDLGKRCLSNLRDFVNDEYLLEYNEVKRLRTLYFLACQKVVGKKVWNENLEQKFWEAENYTKKSKVGDETKVEEVFNTPVTDKYTKEEFSLEETIRIFSLVEDGIKRCQELDEDLYFEINNFEYIYIMFITVVTKV